MKSAELLGRPLAVILILSLLLAAVLPAAALARDEIGDDLIVNSGPALWQQGEAPAYVPVARDLGDMWRSVRMPPAPTVAELLRERGRISLDASPEEIEATVSAWYKKALKDTYIGPDPLAYRNLMAREKAILDRNAAPEDWQLPTPPKSLMAVTVRFDGTDTITRPYPDSGDPGGACVDTEFTWGPLNFGDDPPPGPRDNFEFFKQNFTLEEYEEAFFGEGPDAGYQPFDHPVLGTVDLRGSTLQNYLLESSRELEYRAGGAVLQTTVALDHSHEYYGYARYSDDGGAGPCASPTFSDANYREFAPDVAAAIRDQLGDSLDCSQFDADGDHIVDLFVMIHAGRAFQNGGGEDRLSTSSSSLFPDTEQICGHSTPDDESDDYFVQGFNVDPEQLDVGAIQEEFEHQFGLPDLYATDASNSNAWWGAHSAGVWGGILGGTRPVGHNLWQDYVLGWRDPLVINYEDPELEVTIGRARYAPGGTEDGLIVMLPDKLTQVENLAGEGIGWWSTSGDLMDNTVTREWDLSGATGQVIFSFDAYWDIEEDWDYGFIEVSTDGENWTTLPDMDGILRDTNPNGNNLGWGLTDHGEGNLRFDISSYAGESMVYTRFRYLTDPAVSNPGWWVDNISVDDDSGNLYFNDLETDFSDWTVAGWTVVPFEQIDEQYYLFEWRDDNGFDESLNDAYNFYYNDPEEGIVDRLPYTTPGMTVSYRDTGKDFDYEIGSDLGDSPSYGPKHGLIVIESHNWPKRFDTLFDSQNGGWVGPTPSGRALPGDGAFGHTPTNEWTAHLGYDYDAGQYVDPPIEEKTWPSEAPVTAFHDSMGYYPGFFYPGEGDYVYLNDDDASAAVPAQGDYTTRVTWPDGTPFEALYGVPIGPAGLGTGNPGDSNVQWGVHVEVLEQSEEQATIRFWNSMYEFDGGITQTPSTNPVVQGSFIDVDVTATNIGSPIDAFMVVPIDPDTEYVMGSAYGGATPLTSAAAMQMGMERGLQSLIDLAGDGDPD
ncbi:MAG: immune inhibitor A, partial [Chloroflexota bacterium]|nr:immune inhibitor A [Chloroflexota bacterium]